MCLKYALFLHSLSPELRLIAPVFFTVLSIALTQCIRRITPDASKAPFPPTAKYPSTTTGDAEAGAIPSTALEPDSLSSGAGTATNPQTFTVRAKRAKVQYDYAKAQENEINLVAGEYVLDIVIGSADWWMGTTLMGERGLFPSNYVEIETLSPAKTPACPSNSVSMDDAPPPYAPSNSHPVPAPVPTPTTTAPSASNTAIVPEPAKPKARRRTAGFFVIGTILVLSLLFSLFLLALSYQGLIFCCPWSPARTIIRVIFWVSFFVPAFFATFGLSCYAMLFRDLWGKKARERFKINEMMVATGVVIFVIGGPVFVVGASVVLVLLLVMGAVKCVESAQRAWCGDVLVEDDEERVEIGELRRPEEVIQAEVAMQSVVVDVDGGNGEGSEADAERESEEYGESVRLIKGMER